MGQLYPALVPSAPSSEAMKIPNPHSVAAPAAPEAHSREAASPVSVPVSVAAGGVDALRAARERGAEVGSSGEVVDELLSENERLRLIIEEMSEEVGGGRWVCLGRCWVCSRALLWVSASLPLLISLRFSPATTLFWFQIDNGTRHYRASLPSWLLSRDSLDTLSPLPALAAAALSAC